MTSVWIFVHVLAAHCDDHWAVSMTTNQTPSADKDLQLQKKIVCDLEMSFINLFSQNDFLGEKLGKLTFTHNV